MIKIYVDTEKEKTLVFNSIYMSEEWPFDFDEEKCKRHRVSARYPCHCDECIEENIEFHVGEK